MKREILLPGYLEIFLDLSRIFIEIKKLFVS